MFDLRHKIEGSGHHFIWDHSVKAGAVKTKHLHFLVHCKCLQGVTLHWDTGISCLYGWYVLTNVIE